MFLLFVRIIQSPARAIVPSSESNISVSMSPVVDVTFTRTATGERCLDVLIEETRVNLSITFLINLKKYVLNAMPHEKVEKGFVNRAYEEVHSSVSLIYIIIII